jgi:hypothetical protein
MRLIVNAEAPIRNPLGMSRHQSRQATVKPCTINPPSVAGFMAVAFITGASSGIGLETLILFAGRGCRVYAGARRPEGSTGLQRAIDEWLITRSKEHA